MKNFILQKLSLGISTFSIIRNDIYLCVDKTKDIYDFMASLLQNGSSQQNIWGINIYPDKVGQEGFIEFDWMINIRPAVGNRGRGVYNTVIQKKIENIVNKLVML